MRSRPGFALLVAFAVVVMAAVCGFAIVASVSAHEAHRRVAQAYNELWNLTDSMDSGAERFFQDIDRWPGQLAHMRSAITNSMQDGCGSNYGGRANQWGRPYIHRDLANNTLYIGIGIAQNAIERDPAGLPSNLVVVVNEVDPRDALMLDARVDTAAQTIPSSEGRVRWGTPDAGGRVVLRWRKPITVCS